MLSKQSKGRFVLIGISLMFFIPIFISWYLVFFSSYKDDIKTVNHGELINPIISMGEIKMKSVSNNSLYSHDRTWLLLFVIDGQCEEQCQKNLYQLRQIRLSIGKDQDKLDRLLISSNQLSWDLYKSDYPGQKYIDPSLPNFNNIVSLLKSNKDFNANSIYLIDPYGNLMMQYPKDVDPKGIIKDIERLIRNVR
ncbi:MAG: hypothetical protein HQ470_04900 [Methylophilales bacterium]|nr:hypothetical protein [Methylophilales bacterium]